MELPLSIAQNPSFILVSFVKIHMDADRLDADNQSSKVPESRGTTHPQYITQLLLRGMGKEAQVHRITEQIADDVCWNSARNPGRRSSLWLVLCAAIQTTCPIINENDLECKGVGC